MSYMFVGIDIPFDIQSEPMMRSLRYPCDARDHPGASVFFASEIWTFRTHVLCLCKHSPPPHYFLSIYVIITHGEMACAQPWYRTTCPPLLRRFGPSLSPLLLLLESSGQSLKHSPSLRSACACDSSVSSPCLRKCVHLHRAATVCALPHLSFSRI